MQEFKIVQNKINNKFVVVRLNETPTSPHIGMGKTRSEAMRNALSNHKFAQKTIKGGIEDIIIHFDFKE